MVRSERASGSGLVGVYGHCRRAGNLSLRVFKKDTRYPCTCLFFSGVSSIGQTLAKDTQTPTAKVIFLDAAGRVSEARSGNVSECHGQWVGTYLTKI